MVWFCPARSSLLWPMTASPRHSVKFARLDVRVLNEIWHDAHAQQNLALN